MAYTVNIKRSAEKELSRLSEVMHDRVIKSLLSLKHNPVPSGARKLHGRDGYRLRVGDYRILYQVYDLERRIEVVSIAHRKDVYRL
ncbi:MAG: type II toxin-antitoxin system RelE/ParE family toxin [Deltaproteobacteria bacterium]|nr:type II toxin-antitoxin system RelE/ParE family toxin [Deltaproteobacteria bacterium]